jgi:hypothetical protein
VRAAPDAPPAPLLRRSVEVAALTLFLLWPLAWSGAPLGFFDSAGYYNQGGTAWATLLGAVDGGSSIDGAGAGDGNDDDERLVIRSLPYALFVNATMRALGPAGPVVVVAFCTALLVSAWLRGASAPRRAAAIGGVGLLTAAPFYASQVMPDLMAAWLILVPMIVVRRGAEMSARTAWALAAAALAAALAHYAHLPLALAMSAGLALWLRVARGVRGAPLALLPALAAMGFNFVLSLALPGPAAGPSVAPARHPILLARALEDGIAVGYLREACADAPRYALCEVYADGDFPRTVQGLLWGEGSLSDRATPEQLRAVAEEEAELLTAVLRHDPTAQARAMAVNGARQLTLFGTGDLYEAEWNIRSTNRLNVSLDKTRAPLLDAVATLQMAGVLAALAALALAWRDPRTRVPIAVLAFGLVVNAMICGAFSVPTDRYQGRVIWLCLLAAITLAPASWPSTLRIAPQTRRSRRRPSH